MRGLRGSQLGTLTERLSMLPKMVSPISFFKQMEKIEAMKVELEEKLINENKVSSISIHRFVRLETFENFVESWKGVLANASEEIKKKIIHKFIKKIEIGKNEITIHWLVDEDHHRTELGITANTSLLGKNQKINVVYGSQSLINGGFGRSRTYDLPLRRGLLYPTELRIRIRY
jgi:hypothetical protein